MILFLVVLKSISLSGDEEDGCDVAGKVLEKVASAEKEEVLFTEEEEVEEDVDDAQVEDLATAAAEEEAAEKFTLFGT